MPPDEKLEAQGAHEEAIERQRLKNPVPPNAVAAVDDFFEAVDESTRKCVVLYGRPERMRKEVAATKARRHLIRMAADAGLEHLFERMAKEIREE